MVKMVTLVHNTLIELHCALRQLRPAYFALKNGPWSEPMNFREAEVFDAKRRGGAHEN